jgi:hypothetical protein
VAQEDETRVIPQEDETRVAPSRRWGNPDRVQLGLAFVLGVCLTLAVGGLIFYFADLEVRDDSKRAASGRVSVPNVLGQSTYDAEIELRTARLKPRNDFSARSQNVSFFDTTVKLQSPPPGTRVKLGSTVQLQVE